MANEFNNELQLEIFKTLMSIMRDDKASARDRMQAATMLNTMSVNIIRIKTRETGTQFKLTLTKRLFMNSAPDLEV